MSTTTGDNRQIREVGDIDLSDIAFWTRPPAEREAAFALLRREDPLPFYAEPEPPNEMIEQGPGYYAVTRYADVETVSSQPKLYSSARGATSIADLPQPFLEFFGSMINLDAPIHLRLRRIVSRAFSPRMITRTEDTIVTIAKRIAGDLVEKGPCDFVTEVAAQLPLEVICRMMGVPASEFGLVWRCTNVILGPQDPEYVPEGSDIVAALLGAGAELADLMQNLTQARRDKPEDDLTTALALAEVDGETLTNADIASFFVLLCVAGNETTRNAITSGLLALTDHPDQRAIWQADVGGVTRTAVEEIVRWATPVTWMRRTAVGDTELAGRQIHDGDKLLLFYNSANRDESAFADPGRFDVLRDPNPHLGFGGSGPHYCLGAHLARREIAAMFEELFAVVPDIHAAGEPRRLASSFINGVKHVDCAF